MKSKTIIAAAIAACMLLACASCSTPGVLDASPSPSAQASGADASPDAGQTPEETDDSSYLADFSNMRIVFDGEETDPSVLEFYYNAMVSNFLYSYYSVLDQVGLSLDVPFSEQSYPGTGYDTWYDYFFDRAAYSLHTEYAVGKEAAETGLTLTEQDESEVASIMASYEDAYSGDVEEINAYLKEMYGRGATFDLFEKQVRLSYLAGRWQSDIEESLDFSDEELRGAFSSEEEFESYNYDMVNVRHILVSSEESADEVLAEWQQDPTEENFAALAPLYTEDTGSSSTGGLYEGIMKGDMIEEFENWCFDESRKAGDTGIVATDYGYHVMYFSSFGESVWREQALYILSSDIINGKIDELMAKYPLTID